MTCKEILEAGIQYIEANNIVTDETMLRRAQFLSAFNASKSKVLSDFIAQGLEAEITGSNYLDSYLYKVVYEQGGKYNYFEVAPAVMNGYNYVGGIDGCSRFREMATKAQEQSTLNDQVPSITTYRKGDQYLMVKNNGVNEILASYIPVDPMKVPTFNFDYDQYPVDEALLNSIFNEMFATYQSKVQGKPKDTVSDSQDTTKSIVQ